MDGWMDGWIEGWIERLRDGQRDSKEVTPSFAFVYLVSTLSKCQNDFWRNRIH